MSYNDKEDSYDDIDNTMRKDHTNILIIIN